MTTLTLAFSKMCCQIVPMKTRNTSERKINGVTEGGKYREGVKLLKGKK